MFLCFKLIFYRPLLIKLLLGFEWLASCFIFQLSFIYCSNFKGEFIQTVRIVSPYYLVYDVCLDSSAQMTEYLLLNNRNVKIFLKDFY